MAASLLSVLALALLTKFSPLAVDAKPDPLIQVTDNNWKIVLEGEWMVEFMAPWCPACKSFKSTWKSFAEWSRDLDIKVGVVDVTENPDLSGRFLVSSLPTILHAKDGEFRTYTGARKEDDLQSFVNDKKWQNVESVSSWFHPNSLQMGAVGFFFKLAMMIRDFYNMMTSEYGIPEWGCYIIFAVLTIVAGLLLGLIFVVCCDRMFPPKYVPSHTIPVSTDGMEEDRDDESDVIEDISQDQAEVLQSDAGDTTVRHRQTGSKEVRTETSEDASS